MRERQQGHAQKTAAALASVCERSGRRIEVAPTSYTAPTLQGRTWRTRGDPFEAVWQRDLVPLLEREPALQSAALLFWLQQQHPGLYPRSLLRTLQRRLKKWRALKGPVQNSGSDHDK